MIGTYGKHFVLLFATLALCLGCKPSEGKVPSATLVSPFQAPETQQALTTVPDYVDIGSGKIHGKSREGGTQTICSKPPLDPLKKLYFESFYKDDDETSSHVNRKAKRKYRDQTRKLRQFENRLAYMANQYQLTGGADKNAAICVIDWLAQWAKGDALLGEANKQGEYIRQWTLAALASSYDQVKNYDSVYLEKKKMIEHWLSKVGNKVRSRYPRNFEELERDSLMNNHLYWAAWAVAMTGVAINDLDKYRWGLEKVRYALILQAEKDGTLPLELKRGSRALQYHIFALAPLVMVAEIAVINGENLYNLNEGRLHQIVDLVMANIPDGEILEEKTGHEQRSLDFSREHYSWMEVYNARFPSLEMATFLEKQRPIFARRTGGHMTALFQESPPDG